MMAAMFRIVTGPPPVARKQRRVIYIDRWIDK